VVAAILGQLRARRVSPFFVTVQNKVRPGSCHAPSQAFIQGVGDEGRLLHPARRLPTSRWRSFRVAATPSRSHWYAGPKPCRKGPQPEVRPPPEDELHPALELLKTFDECEEFARKMQQRDPELANPGPSESRGAEGGVTAPRPRWRRSCSRLCTPTRSAVTKERAQEACDADVADDRAPRNNRGSGTGRQQGERDEWVHRLGGTRTFGLRRHSAAAGRHEAAARPVCFGTPGSGSSRRRTLSRGRRRAGTRWSKPSRPEREQGRDLEGTRRAPMHREVVGSVDELPDGTDGARWTP
jgi:hypothetical protein